MTFKQIDQFYINVYLPYQRTEFLCQLISEKYGEFGKMSEVDYARYGDKTLKQLKLLADQIAELGEFDETLADGSREKQIVNLRAVGGLSWADIAALLGGDPKAELKAFFRKGGK